MASDDTGATPSRMREAVRPKRPGPKACADSCERAVASCSVSSRIWKFAACMEAYPERLMDDRSLSREAGTGRYQEIEDKRGVSGEGQATAQRARALVVARSFLFGLLASWRHCHITRGFSGPAPWSVSI